MYGAFRKLSVRICNGYGATRNVLIGVCYYPAASLFVNMWAKFYTPCLLC